MAGAASIALTTRFSSGLFLSLSTLASLALSAGASEHLAIQQASFYLLATTAVAWTLRDHCAGLLFLFSFLEFRISFTALGSEGGHGTFAAGASACGFRTGQDRGHFSHSR